MHASVGARRRWPRRDHHDDIDAGHQLKDGKIRSFEVRPEDAGLPPATLDDLKGGNATVNAARSAELLAGEAGPFRGIVVLDAAAALIVAASVPT